jgi:hypothetical protein
MHVYLVCKYLKRLCGEERLHTALILSVTFIWSHPRVGLNGLWLVHLKYTKWSAFKVIIKQKIPQYLNNTFVNVGAFAPFFLQFFSVFRKKKLLKFTKSCKNEIYLQEIIKTILLSSCTRYNANFKLEQSVFAIHDSPLYFEISEDDHPRTVTHAHYYIDKF